MDWTQWIVPLSAGLVVSAIVAAAKALWSRRKVPTGLSQVVNRDSYLSAILAQSRGGGVRSLAAVVPHLSPAAGSPRLEGIQNAWQDIDGRDGVRLITSENLNSLTAGAELLNMGIEVRVAPELNTEDQSYHVFGGMVDSVVVNHRQGQSNRPGRINGRSSANVFRSHFEQVWKRARPLESMLAGEMLFGLGANATDTELAGRIREVREKYRLGRSAEEAALRHLAFRRSAQVIFITGLPGVGKSFVRQRLADKLRRLRLQVEELTDYPFAYRDFLHSVIRLDEGHGAGFSPEAGGAFRVDNEKNLEPALYSVAERVWKNDKDRTPIMLVEFARSDLVGALQVFGDEVLSRAQVLHVRASDEVRAARLEARVRPPRIQVDPPGVTVVVSDDHRLPSTAAESLYRAEDFGRLWNHRDLAGRIRQVDNEAHDPSGKRLGEKLDGFVRDIVRPYRVLAARSAPAPKAPPTVLARAS